MNLHRLNAPPEPWLGAALEDFERQFYYPLGAAGHFRISHGRDYLPFFAAMGDATVLVAERDRRVLGTLARIRRQLEWRKAGTGCGGVSTPAAHYLCDLKLGAAGRGTRALARLMGEARQQIIGSETQVCYAIVMAGTGRTPTDYTGRIDVPQFQPVGEISILRLAAEAGIIPGAGQAESIIEANAAEALAVRTRLARAGFTVAGWAGDRRSQMPAVHLVEAAGQACGTVEDTRKAKCLWLENGPELLSAHLSGFAYAAPESGARLLRRALAVGRATGLPALFVAVPAGEAEELRSHLKGIQVLRAPAIIYGHGLPAGQDWWVDTAEI